MNDITIKIIKKLVTTSFIYITANMDYEIISYDFSDPKDLHFYAIDKDFGGEVTIAFEDVDLKTDKFYELKEIPIPEELSFFLEDGALTG